MNLNTAQLEKKPQALREGEVISNGNSIFRKSKIKESEIVIAQVCCSRHLHCIENSDHPQGHSDQNNSFSLNSELLIEYNPIDFSAEPLIQYQIKPEVDMLAQINIRKKQYQVLLKKCEQDITKEQREKKLRQLSIQAKNARDRSKKVINSPKSKWGHSIFAEEKKKDQQQKQQQIEKDKVKKQVEMKPINQRIKEYKEQQTRREQQQSQRFERKHRQTNVKEQQLKIQSNANKILEEMRLEKVKKEEQKKVIEAKIRALQLKSKEQVKIAKKKPLEGQQDFNLGDSQYSTFSARANNRKLEKKKKKSKPKPSNDELAATSKPGFLKKSSQNSKRSSAKNMNIKTQQLPQTKINEASPQQEVKGPFFIWNIPVHSNDLQKLEKNSSEVFMNIERFNHKSGKTFREEANEFLTKKMESKMMIEREQIKQNNFLSKVQAQKQILLKTFEENENTKLIDQHFWNEDEVFRPNILQNFHFYTKNSEQKTY